MVVMIWGGQFRNVTWNRFWISPQWSTHDKKNIHKPHVLHPLLPVNELAPVISWTNGDWGLNSQCKHLLDSFGFHIHGKYSIVSSWAFPASPSLILPKRFLVYIHQPKSFSSSSQDVFAKCCPLRVSNLQITTMNRGGHVPQMFRQEWLTSFLSLFCDPQVTRQLLWKNGIYDDLCLWMPEKNWSIYSSDLTKDDQFAFLRALTNVRFDGIIPWGLRNHPILGIIPSSNPREPPKISLVVPIWNGHGDAISCFCFKKNRTYLLATFILWHHTRSNTIILAGSCSP